MPRTDIAGVDGVVVEVLAAQQPRLIADEAVFRDHRRIELDLELEILRNRKQRRAEFAHQDFPRLVQGVDIGGGAVAGLGDLLSDDIVVIALAEAEHGEENAALALSRDKILKAVGVDDAHIEVAVGGENDAVDLVFREVLLGKLVGEREPLAACGRAAGAQIFQRREDFGFLVARRRLQHDAGGARIDDDGNPVVLRHFVDQEFDGLFHQRQLVFRLHRTRHVKQQNDIGVGRLRGLKVEALDADMHQPRAFVPRRRRHPHGRRERRIGAFRLRILIIEVIDIFLDPHRVRRRQHVVRGNIAAHHRIGGGVDIGGEGRDRLLGHELHRIGIGLFILLGVLRRRRHRRRRRIGVGHAGLGFARHKPRRSGHDEGVGFRLLGRHVERRRRLLRGAGDEDRRRGGQRQIGSKCHAMLSRCLRPQ